MSEGQLSQQTVEKIARSFTLLFNQVSMYSPEHPVVNNAFNQFFVTITEGLEEFSPVLLLMDREQFFIEEEPFNPRINTVKMADHFKKAGIQSISFEVGLDDYELKKFITIFINLNQFQTADEMKAEMEMEAITGIKLNYVFFQKVTTDDQVVSREQAASKADANDELETETASIQDLLNMLGGSIVMEGFEESLSLKSLLENPDRFSRAMVDHNIQTVRDNPDADSRPGPQLAEHLQKIRLEVGQALSTPQEVNLPELADAVVKMKKTLLEEIESHKSMGLDYDAEEKIRNEADEITDQVLVRLAQEEYHKGQTTIPRLALILRRLIPDTNELQRLLPKLKTALMDEGMSLADFLQLVQELGKELQSEELSHMLEKSAAQIGLDGEDLIAEIKRDPQQTAELIYLAAEIRRGSGDERVLTELLIEYVEKIGCGMALEDLQDADNEDPEHLQQILAQIKQQLLERLRQSQLGEHIIAEVESGIEGRSGQNVQQLKAGWILRKSAKTEGGGLDPLQVVRYLRDSGGTSGEHKAVLKAMLASLDPEHPSRSKIQKIYDSVLKQEAKTAPKRRPKPAPVTTLNQGNTMFFLKKEILLALRYKIPFAAITFAVHHASARQTEAQPALDPLVLANLILKRLAETVRETDLVGVLSDERMVVLQPMTNAQGAKIALKRLQKKLENTPYTIQQTPWDVKLVGLVTVFNADRTPNLKAFLQVVEMELEDMLNRLRHIQHLI